jgi:hypothetical protein
VYGDASVVFSDIFGGIMVVANGHPRKLLHKAIEDV